MKNIALTLHLQPSEWLSAWQQETGHLVLEARTAPRLQQLVRVMVPLGEEAQIATLVGKVVGVQGQEPLHRIEVAPDEESIRLVRLLAAAARGVPVAFRKRAPRHRVKLPVVVASSVEGRYMNATSVSSSGCSLRWSGPLPTIDQVIGLRFGLGIGAVDVRGIVRWAKNLAAGPAVGVQLDLSRASAAGWAKLVAEAAGARLAGA